MASEVEIKNISPLHKEFQNLLEQHQLQLPL